MQHSKFALVIGLALLVLLSGCATTNYTPDPIDPYETGIEAFSLSTITWMSMP